MMKSKTILTLGAALILAAATTAQQRSVFPSPWNPAGLPAADITQLVFLSWDDNAYSGMAGTQYEYSDWDGTWANAGWVGGNPHPENSAGLPQNPQNPYMIFESPTGSQRAMGMAWAYHALARGNRLTGSNGIPMTFNMITGLFVNTFDSPLPPLGGLPNEGWRNRESFMGFFVPSEEESASHSRIAISWGREMRIVNAGGTPIQTNNIQRIVQNLINAGSEIGNHTIDHMESNSPLAGPNAQFPASAQNLGAQWGFGRWNNELFAASNDNMMSWGVSHRENEMFGQPLGHTAQNRGWLIYGGQQLSENGWYEYIRLSEHFLMNTDPQNRWTGLGLTRQQVQGFRAPRLEVNSAMFFALERAGYRYDMGLEEGYEWHRSGPNFIWPYTMDNGVQNSWTQFSSGNRVFLDSTPQGLWQIPSTPVVVPEDIRAQVWSNHEAIMLGAGDAGGVTAANRDHWMLHGKITGFDFNTWILYGMTGTNWQRTMRNTLDMRINGNRAPMQFGMHTDYYTPIYDVATLMSDFNVNGWGLPVVNGWNTWITRQDETESFVNFAISRGAQFATGAQLIRFVDSLAQIGESRTQHTLPASELPDSWQWVEGTAADVNNATNTAIDNLSGNIKIASTFSPDQPRFAIDVRDVDLSEMTHVSLRYRQTSASMLRLVLDDGSAREVMLAHRFPIISNDDALGNDNGNFSRAALRPSGLIPISAFDFPANTEHPMDYSAVDVSRVVAIEIQPLAPFARPIAFGQSGWSNVQRSDPWEARFEFRDLQIHTGEPFDFTDDNPVDPNPPVSVVRSNRVGTRALSIAGASPNTLRLSVAQAGLYDVGIYTVNGRLVQSFNAKNLSVGINALNLNNLARGVHIVRIRGINTNQQLTRQILIR